ASGSAITTSPKSVQESPTATTHAPLRTIGGMSGPPRGESQTPVATYPLGVKIAGPSHLAAVRIGKSLGDHASTTSRRNDCKAHRRRRRRESDAYARPQSRHALATRPEFRLLVWFPSPSWTS